MELRPTPPTGAPSAWPWTLYAPGETLVELPHVRPLLASWDAKASHAQQEMRQYLDDVATHLKPVIGVRTDLFLSLDIDVRARARLEKHYDLENYLYPLVNHLGHRHFVLATARKWAADDAAAPMPYRERAHATLRVGIAHIGAALDDSWQHVAIPMGPGPERKEWKQTLRTQITAGVSRAPDGPLAVHLAWRAAPTRNWSALWKPTGDALGPILGGPDARPFCPNDDRIVALHLHRNDDSRLGHKLQIGVWWHDA